MAKKRGQAEINRELWNRSNSAERYKWQKVNQKGYEFYVNEQLTEEEKQELRAGGMPDFTINRIIPIVQTMMHFATANNPRWKAVGVEGSDIDVAGVHDDMVAHSLYMSGGKAIVAQAVLDSFTKSLGYLFVDVDKNMDNGMGEVIISTIEPWDVYVDPMSRDYLFRDAAFIIIRKRFSKGEMRIKLPQFKSKITRAAGNEGAISLNTKREVVTSEAILPDEIASSHEVDGTEDPILDYFERYEKVMMKYVNCAVLKAPTTQEQNLIKKKIAAKMAEVNAEIQVQLKEAIAGWDQMFRDGKILKERHQLEVLKAKNEAVEFAKASKIRIESQLQEALLKTESVIMPRKEYEKAMTDPSFAKAVRGSVDFFRPIITVTVSFGDQFLYTRTRPENNYPICPIPFMHTGTPLPMSAVLPLVGKQQEINKAHQIMVHNANLSSNLRWVYQRGAINISDWEKKQSVPGGLLEYRPGFDKPEAVFPAALNNAFFSIVQEGKEDLEYIAGISSQMMGIRKGAQPEPYRATLAQDEYGTRRIRAWMNAVMEPALEHFGNVHRQAMQSHYTIDKTFRIVEPNKTTGEPEERKQRINVPLYDSKGKEIGLWKDYGTANFDVRMVAGSSMPINRQAIAAMYEKWAEMGMIDDIAFIQESDIKNKEALIERKALVNQQAGAIDKLEDEAKEKDGIIITLQKQLIQSGISGAIDKHENQLRGDRAVTKAQLKYLEKQTGIDLEQILNEADEGTKKILELGQSETIDTKKSEETS